MGHRKKRHNPPNNTGSDREVKRGFLRVASIRAANEYVERFHVFAQACEKKGHLEAAFSKYSEFILCVFRLRISPREEENIEADTLEVDHKSGRLNHKFATQIDYKTWLPPMQLRVDSKGDVQEPLAGDGVATYCMWANKTGRYGVAVANDVRSSTDVVYYREQRDPKNQALGWYVRGSVPDMYKPPVNGGRIPYRSLMSAAIVRTTIAHSTPTETPVFKYMGVLNITSTVPYAFSEADCAWAQVCASLLGSLYGSFLDRRHKLSSRGYLLRREKEEKRQEKQEKRRHRNDKNRIREHRRQRDEKITIIKPQRR